MQFEISVDFEEAIILLKVQEQEKGLFIIKTLKKFDKDTCSFPQRMELVRKDNQWHYSVSLSKYAPVVIAAIEHYLKHCNHTVNTLLIKKKGLTGSE